MKHRTPSTASAPHLSNGALALPENISEVDEDNESEDTASLGNEPKFRLPFTSGLNHYNTYIFLEPKIERNDDINPFWIEDKDLKKGPVAFLSPNENQFWKDLIEKYLYPIDDDKIEKVIRIAYLIPGIKGTYFGEFGGNFSEILEKIRKYSGKILGKLKKILIERNWKETLIRARGTL